MDKVKSILVILILLGQVFLITACEPSDQPAQEGLGNNSLVEPTTNIVGQETGNAQVGAKRVNLKPADTQNTSTAPTPTTRIVTATPVVFPTFPPTFTPVAHNQPAAMTQFQRIHQGMPVRSAQVNEYTWMFIHSEWTSLWYDFHPRYRDGTQPFERLEFLAPDRSTIASNIQGFVPGQEYCGGMLTFGARYDTRPGFDLLNPNDNATGLAVLYALLEWFLTDPPACDVDIVAYGSQWTSGCEYCGAHAHIDSTNPEHLPPMMVSFDTLGVGDGLLFEGDSRVTDRAAAIADEIGAKYSVNSDPNVRSSEHVIYRDLGIPSMRIGDNSGRQPGPINPELLGWATEVGYRLAQERW